MDVEFESSRARLALLSGVAAAIRRQFGLEWSPRGYRLRRTRMARMERMVRAPADVDLHIVRRDAKAGTAVIEWEDARGRIRQAEVPQVALQRHARRYGARGAPTV
jgi:hypothetical protein